MSTTDYVYTTAIDQFLCQLVELVMLCIHGADESDTFWWFKVCVHRHAYTWDYQAYSSSLGEFSSWIYLLARLYSGYFDKLKHLGAAPQILNLYSYFPVETPLKNLIDMLQYLHIESTQKLDILYT